MDTTTNNNNLRRPFLAILYALVVFMPALVWIYLYTFNLTLVIAISWTILILSAELSRISGKPLEKQEAAIIFLSCSVLGLIWFPLQWVYQIYFRNSPIAEGFGISNLVPDFYSPPYPTVFEQRTFIDVSWLLPITVGSLFIFCIIITDISLGFFTYQLLVKGEKLPFPLQQVEAEGILTLTERETERLRIFALNAIIGLVYGFMAYGVPFITQSLGFPTSIIPVPWIEFNRFVHLAFPGASFGIATDLVILSLGFVVPLKICLSIFIGSFAFYFIGNYALVHFHLTDFAKEFRFGMSVANSLQRSLAHFWIFPAIGIGVAAGIMPVLRHPKIFMDAVRGLIKKSEIARGIINLRWLLLGILGGPIGSCVLTYIFVPDFPIWILLLLSVGWSAIFAIICARSIGLTGAGFDIPYVNYLVYLGSGYEGTRIWFSPVALQTSAGGPAWCGRFKVSDLCDVNPLDLIKIYLLVVPIAVILGLLYVAEFWKIAPIPSAIYPGVDVYWPIQATIQSLWISKSISTLPSAIVGGFLISSLFFIVFDLLHIPISMIGVATGVFTAIPIAAGILLFAFLRKFLERMLGKGWWKKNYTVLVAGLSAGESIAIVLSGAISVIIKGTFILPY